MGISISGLGSGLDLSGLITQLVAAERLPAQAIEQHKKDTNKQLSAVGDIASKLKLLKTSIESFDQPSDVRAFAATSGDEKRFSVTADGASAPGNYQIAVRALATAQANQSTVFDAKSEVLAGPGSLTIKVGTQETTIEYDEQDSLDAIADRINASGASASASVLFDGTRYRILLGAQDAGAANAMTFTETGASLGFNGPSSQLTAAADAEIEINGISVLRSSNTMSDLLPGLTIQLQSVTPTDAPTTALSVKNDPAGLETKMKTVVDAYNAVAKALGSQLGASSTTRAAETLQSDSTIRGLQSRLTSLMTGGHAQGDNTISLASFGFKLAGDGTIAIKSADLAAQSIKNPRGLADIFLGEGGLSATLGAMVDEYATSGTGVLSLKQDSLRKQLTGYDAQVDRIEQTAASVEARLRKQFSALDSLMSSLTSQGEYLSGLFG